MKTRKITGRDADAIQEILNRHGVSLADADCHVRFFRKRDNGKRLFVQLTPVPRGERIDNEPKAE